MVEHSPRQNETPDAGVIFDVKRFAIHDGPGIRTTVFLKGCPLRCQWCHNPESWRQEPELAWRPSACMGCGRCIDACPNGAISRNIDGMLVTDTARCTVCGQCVEACPSGAREIIGQTVTVAQVMDEIERDLVFYDQSGGGVTFSGGEPLAQGPFLAELLAQCKLRDIHTALDTTCHAPWDEIEPILDNVGLFLCDLKHADPVIHENITGVGNGLILENLKRLAKIGKNMILRVPIIPGLNDDAENLDAVGRFAALLDGVAQIDLLPYNEAMQGKLSRLTGQFDLHEASRPSDEQMQTIADRLAGYGIEVKIGG